MTGLIPMALLRVISLLAVWMFMISVGLAATPAQVTYLWRRPELLARALFAVFVCVPVLAVVLVVGLNLPRAARIGIVLMALSPAGSFSLQRSRKAGGQVDFARSLHLTLCLCAPVTIPLSVAILGLLFPVRAEIPPLSVMGQVLETQLVPLGAGLGIRIAFPRLAARIARPLEKIAVALLLVLVVAVLAEVWRLLFAVSLGTAAAIILVTVVALAVGHLFGGPAPETRTALAIASAARYPGIALLAATVNFPGQGVSAVVLVSMLGASLSITPYQLWRRSSARKGTLN
jgi:BASS family bile acid:Na+ symporter